MQRPWLIVVAAPKEARSVLDALGVAGDSPDGWVPVAVGGLAEVVRSGVGKWAAAGATARCFDPGHHAGVLNVGVAGALPGSWLEIGSFVLGEPSVMADEGLLGPGGFQTLAQMGFPGDAGPVRPDEASRTALTRVVDVVGPVATVSTCSGRDALAQEIATRTRGVAEAMEGAAVGLAARRVDPDARFAELRVISNTTGDRPKQRWDLGFALERLGERTVAALTALNAR